MWEYYPAATIQPPSSQAMSQAPMGSPWMQSSAPAEFNSWDQFPAANQGLSITSDALALQSLANMSGMA